MAQIYKNNYYHDQTAFQQTTPATSVLPSSEYQVFLPKVPTQTKLEQVRFGFNYVKPEVDLHLALRTYDNSDNFEKTCTNGEDLWITHQLFTPDISDTRNKRHIDWIFSKNHIRWEYFIEGYGYTNYLFLDI